MCSKCLIGALRMMPSWAVVVLWLALGHHLSAQETVYVLPSTFNDMVTWSALPVTSGVTYADDAHLASSNYRMAEVVVPVASNIARSATVEVSLYQSAVGGGPGTLLWSSSRSVSFVQPMSNEEMIQQVVFGSIGLATPQDIWWGVKFTNITNYDPSIPALSFFALLYNEADNLALGSPAGTSTDPLRFYEQAPSQPWQYYGGPIINGESRDATLTVRMTADLIPEPAIGWCLAWVGVMVLTRRRR